jgi:hypothetical protein
MIKPVARSILQWLKGCCDTTFSALLIGAFSRKVDFRLALATHTEVVLLGNGPSLTGDLELNPRLGAGRDLMCVNNFVFSEDFVRLKPSYYAVMDPFYWASEAPASVLVERERFFECLKSRTAWPMNLLLPLECRFSEIWKQENLCANTRIKVRFFNRTPVSGFKWFRNLAYAHDLGMPWSQNVLVGSAFLCVGLGFKRIYVLGADHSWHEEICVGKDNVLYLKQKHCYDAEEDVPLEPVYKPNTNEAFKMHELFAAWSRVFLGHLQVAEYARERGVEILNASSKTYIDAFERIDVRAL